MTGLTLPTEELPPGDPRPMEMRPELVRWMEPGPLRLQPTGLALTAIAGLAAGLGAVAAFRWLAPRREGLPPWKWRRGPLH